MVGKAAGTMSVANISCVCAISWCWGKGGGHVVHNTHLGAAVIDITFVLVSVAKHDISRRPLHGASHSLFAAVCTMVFFARC